jgi:hypothetical protein
MVVAPENYVALLPDRLPAYITQERYERIQRRLQENRARLESKGAPREGASLLAGLVFCAHCGYRLAVHYSGRQQKLRYTCRSGAPDCRQHCRSMSGQVLDALVAEQVLAVLQPGALELSLAAGDDVVQERQRLDENRRQRLERVRYQAQRIERHYQAVEPENRLVARTLEQRWEEVLQEVRQLEENYARFRRQQPATLTSREAEQIRKLSQDLPALWHAPTTTPADRQEIIRLLVERVVVALDGPSDRLHVSLTWVGGHTSAHELVRPVLRYEQSADFPRLLARIWELRGEGQSFSRIAERLNAEGFRPIKRCARFHCDLVAGIVRQRSADRKHPAMGGQARGAREVLRKNEWLVVDLAVALGIAKSTLHAWMRRGWVHYRRLEGYRAPCLCWADARELRRLRRLYRTPRGWWDPPLPVELTTPLRPSEQ